MSIPDPTHSSLSKPEQQLVSLMRRVWCGRLTQVPVQNGQPVLAPPMKVTRLVKLRLGEDSVAKAASPDFTLKQEVVELFRQTRALRQGMIERLEVMHGLPTVAELSEPLPPATTPRATSTAMPAR